MYHLWHNGQQTGPHSREELRRFVREGSANAQSLVWQEGMADWAPIGQLGLTPPPPPPPKRIIAGLVPRGVAWMIDGIILCVPVLLLGIPLFGFFASLGDYGLLLGFAIALAYFGLLNSAIGRGRTIGKSLLGIEVVDARGEHLTLVRSLLRYVVLGVPFYFFNEINQHSYPTLSLPNLLTAAIVIAWGGTVLYLYVCNRRTGQGLHDLVTGSYVVSRLPPGPVEVPPVWRWHWAVPICLLLLVVSLIAYGSLLRFTPKIVAETKEEQSLMASGEFRSITVDIEEDNLPLASRLFYDRHGERVHRDYFVWAKMKNPSANKDDDLKKVARVMLDRSPKASDHILIFVTVDGGYNLGLAHWPDEKYSIHTPSEWRQILAGTKPLD